MQSSITEGLKDLTQMFLKCCTEDDDLIKVNQAFLSDQTAKTHSISLWNVLGVFVRPNIKFEVALLKTLSFPLSVSSTTTCQYPEPRSIVVKYVAPDKVLSQCAVEGMHLNKWSYSTCGNQHKMPIAILSHTITTGEHHRLLLLSSM